MLADDHQPITEAGESLADALEEAGSEEKPQEQPASPPQQPQGEPTAEQRRQTFLDGLRHLKHITGMDLVIVPGQAHVDRLESGGMIVRTDAPALQIVDTYGR